MRKIRLKQGIVFVIFILAVAAMDSQLYITAGVLAIASAIYMYSTVVEEKRYVYELRRQKNRDKDRIWEHIRQWKGENRHEKENSVSVTGIADAVAADSIQLAG